MNAPQEASRGSGSRAETLMEAPIAAWLAVEPGEAEHKYVMRFAERHIGNPFIRALHGGAVGAMIEFCAALDLALRFPEKRSEIASSAIDYLRVTRDSDLHVRVEIVRIARRLAFLDVWCWQDDEDTPVARGSCTLRLFDE